jgi:hypothetical protein
MLTLANDFEYVVQYKKKEFQKEILEYFWKKYQPLVRSVVKRYYHHHIGTLDFEDCIQNSFLYMIDCLEALKLNKIKNKELFSFGAYLKFRLRGSNVAALRTDLKYENKSVVFYNENYSIDHISSTMLSAMMSRINVETQVLDENAYDRLKLLLFEFYNTRTIKDQQLFELCVDKATSVKKGNQFYWVDKAKFLKVGYSKNAKKTNDITPQYFYRCVANLERAYIQFMQKYGFYSKSSLRSFGLGKLS